MYIKHRSKLYTVKALIKPISIIALIIPKPCELMAAKYLVQYLKAITSKTDLIKIH